MQKKLSILFSIGLMLSGGHGLMGMNDDESDRYIDDKLNFTRRKLDEKINNNNVDTSDPFDELEYNLTRWDSSHDLSLGEQILFERVRLAFDGIHTVYEEGRLTIIGAEIEVDASNWWLKESVKNYLLYDDDVRSVVLNNKGKWPR